MKIDFDGVQAFVMIAELGGFSKAAQQLHITQTALTRRIQKLEAYLDLKLLDRTARRVELTAVGREFLPQARNIVHDMTTAVERLKDMSHRAKGNFTLACIPSMTSHVLPEVIRCYAAQHPDLSKTVLFADPLAFICRSSHPLQANKSVTWTDLRSTELIMIGGQSANRVLIDYQLTRKRVRLDGHHEVQHLSTALGLVGPVISRTLALTRRTGSTLSPAA